MSMQFFKTEGLYRCLFEMLPELKMYKLHVADGVFCEYKTLDEVHDLIKIKLAMINATAAEDSYNLNYPMSPDDLRYSVGWIISPTRDKSFYCLIFPEDEINILRASSLVFSSVDISHIQLMETYNQTSLYAQNMQQQAAAQNMYAYQSSNQSATNQGFGIGLGNRYYPGSQYPGSVQSIMGNSNYLIPPLRRITPNHPQGLATVPAQQQTTGVVQQLWNKVQQKKVQQKIANKP